MVDKDSYNLKAVHNLTNITKAQIQSVMNKDSTVIVAFCNSCVCLKALE